MNRTTRAAVIRRDGRRCVRCSSPNNLTVDHIVPRSKLSKLFHDIDKLALFHHMTVERGMCNYQTMCRRCNKGKDDGPAVDYRNSVSLFHKLTGLIKEFELPVTVKQGTPIWREESA